MIKEKLSDLVYKLKLPNQWRIHNTFHALLLTPFIQTEEHGPSFSHPPPDIVEGEEEYEIEAILRHKGKGKRKQYFVRWKGYEDSENMWLQEQELKRNAKDLLDEYREAQQPIRSRKYRAN